MVTPLKEQIREFCSAVIRSYSYNIFKNVYIWFGIFWGLPISLITLLCQSLIINTQNFPEIVGFIVSTPVKWILLTHPLLFGVLFGILGTIKQQKDEEVIKLIEELKLMSVLDPLTGLSNRRFFIQEFEEELSRLQRKKNPLSLIFLDLDHFKKINDTYGHRMGDRILQAVARHLRSHCRPYDNPARWGGEEFLILLADTDEKKANEVAERIRQDIKAGFNSSIPAKITVSIGVTQYKQGDTIESFIDRADKALYHAKSTGRNKVVSWSSL